MSLYTHVQERAASKHKHHFCFSHILKRQRPSRFPIWRHNIASFWECVCVPFFSSGSEKENQNWRHDTRTFENACLSSAAVQSPTQYCCSLHRNRCYTRIKHTHTHKHTNTQTHTHTHLQTTYLHTHIYRQTHYIHIILLLIAQKIEVIHISTYLHTHIYSHIHSYT